MCIEIGFNSQNFRMHRDLRRVENWDFQSLKRPLLRITKDMVEYGVYINTTK